MRLAISIHITHVYFYTALLNGTAVAILEIREGATFTLQGTAGRQESKPVTRVLSPLLKLALSHRLRAF